MQRKLERRRLLQAMPALQAPRCCLAKPLRPSIRTVPYGSSFPSAPAATSIAASTAEHPARRRPIRHASRPGRPCRRSRRLATPCAGFDSLSLIDGIGRTLGPASPAPGRSAHPESSQLRSLLGPRGAFRGFLHGACPTPALRALSCSALLCRTGMPASSSSEATPPADPGDGH